MFRSLVQKNWKLDSYYWLPRNEPPLLMRSVLTMTCSRKPKRSAIKYRVHQVILEEVLEIVQHPIFALPELKGSPKPESSLVLHCRVGKESSSTVSCGEHFSCRSWLDFASPLRICTSSSLSGMALSWSSQGYRWVAIGLLWWTQNRQQEWQKRGVVNDKCSIDPRFPLERWLGLLTPRPVLSSNFFPATVLEEFKVRISIHH